ncbi:hypothetical protein ABB37_00217 [Leptomonas pyrrhocoris]|uniref:Arrestin-like N-terminal domain-containing protein n=1 Tax=Leptomonas pyrrhocoris TaxID=157538 RepID=A0A0N0E011_LEPPY|nr:hypothetical protein ABB37_00217 [Leptomonas pyrrhocoris]KPA85905.1 hypothetical protein ABB37_00217 [Leptomonas pyrrhocoris]|eukprot:XP_015664344.1 hypothetical protein ABB37_00217 [Leptomonas pyrrhocoris]
MPSSRGVSLSIAVAEAELAPGNFLHGEVKVKVDSSYRNGVVYEAVRLDLLSIEHSCVWDDQGEFDALLNEYTSSRVYLDRHVTLAGFKTRTEDAETAAQCKQELMFHQHRATPYAAVAPTKRKRDAYRHYPREELAAGGVEMAAGTTHTASGAAPGASVKVEANIAGHEAVQGGNEPIGTGDNGDAQRTNDMEAVDFPVLMPGTHTFPFAFRLPPWLPPSFYYSFHGAIGELKYSAYATMLFPGNGAGSWCYQLRKDVSNSARDAQATFHRIAVVPAAMVGGPVLRRRDGTLGRAGNMDAPLSSSQHTSADRARSDDGVEGQQEGEIDVGDEVAGERSHRRLRHLPLYSPADLVAETVFDVLSVMPRRQLVAEYYQIDTLNLNKRQGSSTSNAVGQQDHNWSDICGDDGHTAAGVLVSKPYADTHLASSSLYQSFRCGWMNNLCCLQSQNALEAEVLVVGARTVLLADQLGASCALGVRPPPSAAGIVLGAPVLRSPAPVLPPDAAVAASDVPWPVGGVMLRVRVRNHCPKETVRRVRVELKAKVEIFRSLVTPHTFPGISYSSFDYTTPIPPGNEALFDVRLGLTPRFRRHATDSASLLPPPGVRTANMTSNAFVQVSFPGMCTYVEEEEETKGVVIMAETVDLNDEVLELPVRYS